MRVKAAVSMCVKQGLYKRKNSNVGYVSGPSFVRAMELKILYEIGIPSVRMVGVGRFVTFATPKFQ